MSREKLHIGIKDLKTKIREFGELSLSMLKDAMEALYNQDSNLSKKVYEQKDKIRAYDDQIEDEAFKLIALYQPMAIDMRRLGAILKIITHLYRIGRYGKDIANIAEELSKGKVKISVNIRHIYEHVEEMIHIVLKAFEEEEIDLIEDFTERDNEVDDLRWSIFRECVTYMMEDPRCITPCSHYIMVARYLERCGDHACKIAEKVHYVVTGEWTEIS